MDMSVFAEDSRKTQKGASAALASSVQYDKEPPVVKKCRKPAVEQVVEEDLNVDLGGHFETLATFKGDPAPVAKPSV